MRKILDFFIKPKNFGFHILLAIVITLVVAVGVVQMLDNYTRHGEEIQMPSFIGENAQNLISDSLNSDFVFVVSEQVFDKESPEGTILKQNPLPNESVKTGRKVYFTTATSLPPKVKMPLLVDVSLRQAEIMLKAIGLKLGKVILKPCPYENAVLEQLYRGRPVFAGQEVPMGEEIVLVVGKDINELPKSDSLRMAMDSTLKITE